VGASRKIEGQRLYLAPPPFADCITISVSDDTYYIAAYENDLCATLSFYCINQLMKHSIFRPSYPFLDQVVLIPYPYSVIHLVLVLVFLLVRATSSKGSASFQIGLG